MISVTRIYRFSASHRLHSARLSDMENAALYGKCNNPYGHGHDYVLSVTASGPVDERTGLLLSVAELDSLVQEKVLRLFAHSNINVDVQQFADVVPTTENVALAIADLLQRHWREYITAGEARLHRVHVQETERNGFEVLMPTSLAGNMVESEDVLVHA